MKYTIDLNHQNLTKLTEQNLKDLCKLSNFKLDELTELNLYVNKLTDLDFIQPNTPFINLKILNIGYNNITDINNIKYLKNLEDLNITENNTISDFSILINLKKLKFLFIPAVNKNKKELARMLFNLKDFKILYIQNMPMADIFLKLEREEGFKRKFKIIF